MVILGLDASISCTGYCIYETTKNKPIKISNIKTKKEEFQDEDSRIVYICNEIIKLIETYNVDKVVIEDQFISINGKTVLSLRKMLGALMYSIYLKDICLEYLYPTTIRKLLLNNGRAKKEIVAEYIRENIIDIGVYSDKNNKSKTSDMYDAIAVTIAYCIKNKYI